jgi:ribosomal protein S18 acetylase RimI-like enzyme
VVFRIICRGTVCAKDSAAECPRLPAFNVRCSPEHSMAIATSKIDADFLPVRQGICLPASASDAATSPLVITTLSAGDEDEALNALSAHSLTNVIMSGFIRDNGLISPLNRGRFYSCRNQQNGLEGIALIGHTILFEAFTEEAIEAFAALAREVPSLHLLMGEHDAVRRFWNYYAGKERSPRLLNPVLFLQQPEPFAGCRPVHGLRPATPEDLGEVMTAQAAMAFETSGVDPSKKDPQGFRERCLRRVEQGRVWVLLKNGRLVFKTDVIAETPEAAYIEGVYVSPCERGKGYGRRCLAEVGRLMLKRTGAIYLFAENLDARLRGFYESIGFRFGGHYNLLYF